MFSKCVTCGGVFFTGRIKNFYKCDECLIKEIYNIGLEPIKHKETYQEKLLNNLGRIESY